MYLILLQKIIKRMVQAMALVVVTLAVSVPASAAQIKVDGDPSDWSGVDMQSSDNGKIAKWASDAMKAAYAMGYLTGSSSDGKLYAKPTDTISRQEAMVILSRTLPESTASADDLENRFSDADKVAKWAREPLAQMLQAGIISGSNGKLNPTGKVTRAQVAKMLYQLQQQ